MLDVWAGEVREKGHQPKHYFYEEGWIIVCLPDERIIYGNIRNIVTDEISQIELVKYVKEKTPHWTDNIFVTTDLGSMIVHMGKTSDQRVTNVIKFVYWRHLDGQQKNIFYGEVEDTICPVGGEKRENRMHYVQCNAIHLQKGHIKYRIRF